MEIFFSIDLLGILFVVIPAIICGYLFREYEFDSRTVKLFMLWYTPLMAGRVLYVITIGTVSESVGSDSVAGVTYFLIYFSVAYLTRKIARHYNW